MNETLKKNLDFHADDFGISENSCKDILSLISNGYLNSISILPNMNTFDYAVNNFKMFQNKNPDKIINITIHLNFMEGHCCSEQEKIHDLVDSKGYFKISWGSLFKLNYNFLKRNKIKKQLKIEILSQTYKCINSGIIKKDNLRFDGHQHTHMIPIVFEALLDAISELEKQDCKVTFIRNTQDPIIPYYIAASKTNKIMRKSFNKINLIKCIILNYFSLRIRSKLKNMNLPLSYLCGVFFSGHMDSERLEKILPYYCKKPLKQKRPVELLFHPGSVLKEEITEEFVKPDFNSFHLSQNRKIEYNSIVNLN